MNAKSSRNREMQSPNNNNVAKKFGHMVRVIYFMLKKGFSKNKLILHLKYLMMKRTKLAGKSIQNLLHHSSSTSGTPKHQFPDPLNEYEFSCSNSPAAYTTFFPFHKKKNNNHNALIEDDLAVHAVMKALEMLKNDAVSSSPDLPGLGKSPVAVRDLRITDSPFPMRDMDEDSHVVDEAAEEFIQKFYNNLRRQNAFEAN